MVLLTPPPWTATPAFPASSALRAAVGLGARRPVGAGAVRLALVAATLVIFELQLTALPLRDPLRDPLSTYVHTPAGWLFPVGLFLLGLGMLGTAARLRRVPVPRARGSAAMVAAGALAAFVAAAFPADVEGLAQVTWRGETHRYASVGLLVLPLLAASALLRPLRTGAAGAARRLAVLVAGAGAAGVLFLAGFLPTLFPGTPALLRGLPAVSGLFQRLLVLLLVLVLAVLAGSHGDLAGGDEFAGRVPKRAQPLSLGHIGEFDGQRTGRVDLLAQHRPAVQVQVEPVEPGGVVDHGGLGAGALHRHLEPADR
jgi:hypothetical protein